jgi:N4-gp56 family major capsid protein
MADVPFGFTTTNTGSLSNLIETAYDQYARLALRSVPLFRTLATVKPVSQTNPGDTVTFHIHQNLAPATTPLNEVADPAGVSLANPTRVSVTVEQYGNFTVLTKLVRELSLDQLLDTNAADQIAYNMADSIDIIVERIMATGTNVIKEVDGALSTSPSAVADSPIKARDIAYAAAKLRKANVRPVDGQYYVAFIHPEVAHDLRREAGAGAWREPATYVNPEGIYAGEIGVFEGVRFIETPRVGVNEETGVYNTYIVGSEFLAEAVVEEPHVIADGVVVDPLKRKMAIGWAGVLGWNLFRPEALWRIETISTIA